MKNSNDTIGNRPHDLPACSAVPQPIAPLLTPSIYIYIYMCVCVCVCRLLIHFGNAIMYILEENLLYYIIQISPEESCNLQGFIIQKGFLNHL